MTVRPGRFRWYKLSFNNFGSISDVVSKLDAFWFDPTKETSNGFKVDAATSHLISAKFISKNMVSQVINLPVGGEFTQIVADIATIDFDIGFDGEWYLCIKDSPRSTVQFFTSLSLVFDFGCVIEPIVVDLNSLLVCLRNRLEGVEVSYIEVSNVWLGSEVQLRAAVSGGSEVESELRNLLKGRSSVFECVRLKYSSIGGVKALEVNRRAGLKITKGVSLDDFEIFRTSFMSSVVAG